MQGDYRQAIDVLARNVASMKGELAQKRFGLPALPAVTSRALLAYSLAECGAFTEGIAHGEEALQIAEAADHVLTWLWPLCWVLAPCTARSDRQSKPVPS